MAATVLVVAGNAHATQGPVAQPEDAHDQNVSENSSGKQKKSDKETNEEQRHGVSRGTDGETILIEGTVSAPVPGRASTEVTLADIRERQPRSVPDALRYEPGVYVQQTSAAQGSAFVRGRTGQQSILLFDGIRLNNSLYRQGPNQYFFTIDMRTVERIEVTRGGASTLYGSDAIAGVLDAKPAAPDPGHSRVRPSGSARMTTADDELGGRMQIDAAPLPRLAVSGGVGYRQVGFIESGGPVLSPVTGEPPQVPRFASDGRTQLGTGFDELTMDARAVYTGGPRWRATAAAYGYMQTDAPRTDQCAPPYASASECLRFDEQFHTLAYAALDGRLGRAADTVWLALSYQHQRERRTRDRPMSFVQNGGRDEVTALGAATRNATAWIPIGAGVRGRLRYGGDIYHDRVDSSAWTIFTDTDYVSIASRGQYLAGSRYTTSGLFAGGELDVEDRLVFRGGGRLPWVAGSAPADPQSGTAGIDASWTAAVGYLSLEWRPAPQVELLATLDRSFRAPNLDDLTSRQATGPGFQFENATLVPEVAVSGEIGIRISTPRLRLEGWAYASSLRDAITRAQRDADECPPETPACTGAWFRYQLVNLDGRALIIGAELTARLQLVAGIEARATLSYARGDGPNPQERPSDPSLPYQERIPLSRIPPLNGSAEVRWQHGPLYLAAGARAATKQDRLANTDRSDERIPQGGTPGFVVTELRAGYSLDELLRVHLVFENVFDAAYRYHGSSINGPGRGLILSAEFGI